MSFSHCKSYVSCWGKRQESASWPNAATAETIAALMEHKPDLLLLDVHMPAVDGFQVVEGLQQDPMPLVIFTTAYDRYAIRAFEAQAFDYILKPFDQERIHRTIVRTRAELLKMHDAKLAREMFDAFGRSAAPSKGGRISFKSEGRVVFLETDEIGWIEACANYVRLHSARESYLVRESIGKIAERLDSATFVRIHRSIIVNAGKIRELQPCNSGEYIVVLKDGKELPCSRGYRGGIQQMIGGTSQ